MATSTLNHRIRFYDQNFVSQVTYSSALGAFPGDNIKNSMRSKVWKPSGHFEITTLNQALYIDDGSPKTVNITTGDYTTPAALATQIQTDLNSASSNWTVTYSTSTYKFTISNSGSVTLRYSQTSNAIWDDIGFTGSSDTTGTSFVADVQRNHTEEYAVIDIGYQETMEFFGVISSLAEVFTVSNNATVTLEANNTNTWTATPPLSETLTVTDNGIFLNLEDSTGVKSYNYRYWRFKVVDRENPLGPEGLTFGHMYLGTMLTLTNRNVRRGFNKSIVDPSDAVYSESGVAYYNTKTKFRRFEGVLLEFLDSADRLSLEQFFHTVGTTEPFYVSLDPLENISEDLDELTIYGNFEQLPNLTHIKTDIYSLGVSIREAL